MADSSMKDIKLRIRSVESTRQITKAMQLVATSKIRRAKERMEESRSYSVVTESVVRNIVANCKREKIPYTIKRTVRKRCYVVIAGDRGLAGGYNANVFKAVAAHSGDIPYCVLPIGRKAIEKYQRIGVDTLSNDFAPVSGMTVPMCYNMAQLLINAYDTEEFDEVWLVSTDFRSMITQDVVTRQLLPLSIPDDENSSSPSSTLFEPDPETMMKKIIRDILAGWLYSALCDASACENAARRNAMDSATKNADQMISNLTLKYNQARQGSITQEITEIVAGAEK